MNENNNSVYKKALAAAKYSFYVNHVHRDQYQHGRHTRLIAKELQEIEKKHAQGIPTFTIFEMPPRHSKSMSISETFPSYFIGKDPSRRVITTSYGDSLARKFGRLNRNKLEEFGPDIFNVSIDRRNSSVTNWSIDGHRGGMISTGIGGAITGEGADLLIIDDPIKNRKEADSPTYREMVWQEWQNTLSTRLQPGASVIIILTRWHEDDLVGRLLENDPREWKRVRFPAIAEEEDILGRKPGEALWPERGYDEEWAATAKKAVGTRVWEALFQQNPRPQEGSTFKRGWFKYYKAPPSRFDEIVQSWDCAFKDLDSSDYVVGQVWGRIGADLYLLDQVRDRMNVTATMNAIKAMTSKWPKAHGKYIEDKANGTAVMQILSRKVPGLIPVNPEGGKEARANATAPTFESGNIFLPETAPWLQDYIEEMIAFPNGKNDDQVDATTQAVLKLVQPFEVFIGRAH